jgi:GNAT superfamily N-acetyltransferase
VTYKCNLKNSILRDRILVIPKPEYVSWDEITQLLHIGYSERRMQGLDYSAASQSVQKTIERVSNGVCLVALLDGKLIGTESYRMIRASELKFRRWYHDDCFFYLHSLTVLPEFKRMGIGTIIRNKIVEEAYQKKVDSLISDTSAHAKWLISWYSRLGHKKVGQVSHPTTNYFSIVMRTPICGKKYNELYRRLMYLQSFVLCRLAFRRDGRLRLLGNVFKRLLTSLRKSNEVVK